MSIEMKEGSKLKSPELKDKSDKKRKEIEEIGIMINNQKSRRSAGQILTCLLWDRRLRAQMMMRIAFGLVQCGSD